MTHVFNNEKKSFRLGERIASGGEGTVHRLADSPNLCVKIYHNTHVPDKTTQFKLQVLQAKANLLKDYAALPQGLAFASNIPSPNPIGIFLNFVTGHDIFELYNPGSRDEHFPNRRFDFLVRVSLNLCRAFHALHAQDVILGDISEKNIKVRSDGTVTIIDCDSFQVKTGSFTFRCPVGTPIWTAPELHNFDLSTIDRTVNHDHFGLAQLIFLLLFAGRYPFAGVPVSGNALQMDEAIRRHAFAYDEIAGRTLQTPPPGAPPFSAIPDYLQKLFVRSFCQGSTSPGARPTSADWIAALSLFENEFQNCTYNTGHIFWKNAKHCPWCAVYKKSNWELFPFHSKSEDSYTFNFSATVDKLSGMTFDLLVLKYSPIADKLEFHLPPKPTGMIATAKKSINRAWWVKSWLYPSLAKALTEKKVAQKELETIMASMLISGRNFTMATSDYSSRVSSLRQRLENPTHVTKLIESEFHEVQKSEQLSIHLSKKFVRLAKIDGIGAGREAILASYGINSANDITSRKILSIPGFGRGIFSKLLNWREICEKSFIYDSRKPFSPAIKVSIHRKSAETLNKVDCEASSLFDKYYSARKTYELDVERLQDRLNIARTRLRQLEFDETTLSSYLKRGGVRI